MMVLRVKYSIDWRRQRERSMGVRSGSICIRVMLTDMKIIFNHLKKKVSFEYETATCVEYLVAH